MKRIASTLPLSLFAALAIGGCGDDSGNKKTAQVDMYVWGEEYIEDEIPAEEFVDAWSVTFDSFVVAISSPGVGTDGDLSVDGTSFAVDLAKASPDSDNPGFRVATIAAASDEGVNTATWAISPGPLTNVNVDDADLTALNDAGASVLVRGTAEDKSCENIPVSATDGATPAGIVCTPAGPIDFEWNFALDATYESCTFDTVATSDAEAAYVQLTVHGDHVFYDDLGDDPNVAFDVIASADTNSDGTVTMDELKARDITAEERYQGGNDIDNLYDFIAEQLIGLGHIQGEGHCELAAE